LGGALPDIGLPDRNIEARIAPLEPLSDHPATRDGARSAHRPRPVFLHGLWRSGSTYVWSRFRVAEGAVCYYEPLHDGLRRLTRRRIERDTPQSVTANRHPTMEQPYFAEYGPLIGLRGVRRYRRRFAYDRFALAPGAVDPALSAYIQGLIDHAAGQERAAVLGFNRTGLRLAWLQRRFEACNIHIDRDPTDVFASYLNQLQAGNHYYFVKWMQIVAGNADYPLFQRIARRIPNASWSQRLLLGPKKFYRAAVEDASVETLYALTFLAWAACALHALGHSDMIIDVGQAAQPGYAEDLSAAVRIQTGLDVRFDDMHAPSPPSPLSLANRAVIEQEVLDDIAELACDGLIDRARVRQRLGELSPRRANLLARIV
jgi:hypothetical protein